MPPVRGMRGLPEGPGSVRGRTLTPVDETAVEHEDEAAAEPVAQESPEVQASPEAPPRPSSLGIWALVLALLGLCLLPVIGSVLGFILGWVAMRRAEVRPVRGGRGLALAALLVGLIPLVLIALGCAAYALVLAFAPA